MSTREFAYEISSPKEITKKGNTEEATEQLNPMEKFYYALKNTADRHEKVYLDNLKSRMKKF